MLSFENFILRQNEGLIISYPIDKAIETLNDKLLILPFWYSIKKENDSKFILTISGVLNINQIESIFELVNNLLGYYCSFIKYYKTNISRGYPFINIEDYILKSKSCKKIDLYFEAKFDELLSYKPDIIFHVTDEINLKNIHKVGIIPKSKNKKSFHLERIYITLNKGGAEKFIKNLSFNDNLLGITKYYKILEINITDEFYKDMKIYKDPNMKGGYYIYNNIRPQDIKIIDG
jgi:hypothetical protein